MSNPTPIESLGFLASLLQRMSLPHIADKGHLSHTLVAQHVANVERALTPAPPEESVSQSE